MNINDIKIRNAYSVGKDLIFVYHDGKKRKKLKIENYLWYCVIKWSDWEANKYKLEKLECLAKVEQDGDYAKLFSTKHDAPSKTPAKRLIEILNSYNIEVFEGDLHSAKRFMVDNEIQVDDQYDILYFDIETDDTNRKIEIGKERILSFGAVDNYGNEFYFDDKDEKTLLKNIFKLWEKYDVITGWNSDEFDIPYIEARWERVSNAKIRYKGSLIPWHKVARIDMMKRTKKLFKEDAGLKSYSLENVCQHFLKKGKIKFEGKVVNLPPKKLQEYNMNDVYLLKELDEKTGMIDLIAKECAVSKCLIRDFAGIYVSQVLDNMILREAHKQGKYCPSKKTNVEETDYVGGLVFEPETGYHNNVYVFDFTSLYPSIIMTSNIGFDSLTKEEGHIKNPGTGVSFRKDYESVIAKVVRQLVEERQVYKKLRLKLVEEQKYDTEEYTQARANEIIVKELSNSVYGIMGNRYLRYYQLEIAESITKTGHYLLNFTREFFNAIDGLHVIYGDTDSVFVASPNKEYDVEVLLKDYHVALEKDLKKFNIEKSYIQLKYEKFFSGMILVGKKYYAGQITNIEGKSVNKFEAKGLDLVKKAALPITLESQKKVINLILDGAEKIDVEVYVRDIFERIQTGDFGFDELKISTKINKEVKDYKMLNAPHVKLARSLIEKTGVLEVNEIEYIVKDDSAPKDTLDGLVMRDDYTGEFDKSYYWNQKIFPPMHRIINAVWPTIDWEEMFLIKKIKKKDKPIDGQRQLF